MHCNRRSPGIILAGKAGQRHGALAAERITPNRGGSLEIFSPHRYLTASGKRVVLLQGHAGQSGRISRRGQFHHAVIPISCARAESNQQMTTVLYIRPAFFQDSRRHQVKGQQKYQAIGTEIRLHAGYVHRNLGCSKRRIVVLQKPVAIKGSAVWLRSVTPGIVVGFDQRNPAHVLRAHKQILQLRQFLPQRGRLAIPPPARPVMIQ